MNKYTIEKEFSRTTVFLYVCTGAYLTYKSNFLARSCIHVGRLAVRPNKSPGCIRPRRKQ